MHYERELMAGKHRHFPHARRFVATAERFAVVQMETGKCFWWKEQGPTGKDLSEVGDEPEGNWFH